MRGGPASSPNIKAPRKSFEGAAQSQKAAMNMITGGKSLVEVAAMLAQTDKVKAETNFINKTTLPKIKLTEAQTEAHNLDNKLKETISDRS